MKKKLLGRVVDDRGRKGRVTSVCVEADYIFEVLCELCIVAVVDAYELGREKKYETKGCLWLNTSWRGRGEKLCV